jgi:hypothetical protein
VFQYPKDWVKSLHYQKIFHISLLEMVANFGHFKILGSLAFWQDYTHCL